MSDYRIEWDHARREYERGRSTVRQLARTAVELRRQGPVTVRDRRGYKVEIEPCFKLKASERRWLAVELVREGADDKQIMAWTQISKTTLWRVRNEGSDPPKDSASQAGLRVSNEANPTSTLGPSVSNASGFRSTLPLLHFDASSGGSDLIAARSMIS